MNGTEKRKSEKAVRYNRKRTALLGDVNIKLRNYNLLVNLELSYTSVGSMSDWAILPPRNALDMIFGGMVKEVRKCSGIIRK